MKEKSLKTLNDEIGEAVRASVAGDPGAVTRVVDLGRQREERLKRKRKPPEYHVHRRLRTPARRMMSLRMIRIFNYRKATDFGFVFNAWNPLSWPVMVVFAALHVVFRGREAWATRHEAGFAFPPGYDAPDRATGSGLKAVSWMDHREIIED